METPPFPYKPDYCSASPSSNQFSYSFHTELTPDKPTEFSHIRDLSFSPKYKDMFSIQRIPTPKELKPYVFNRNTHNPKRPSFTETPCIFRKPKSNTKNSSLGRKMNSSKLDISYTSSKNLNSIYNNIPSILTQKFITPRSRSLSKGIELKKNIKLMHIMKSPRMDKTNSPKVNRKIDNSIPMPLAFNLKSPKKFKIVSMGKI